MVDNLCAKTAEGRALFGNVTFELNKGDKVAVLSRDPLAVTALFRILMDERKADEGSFRWGVTITPAFLPNENDNFFTEPMTLIDWLRQYSEDKDEQYVRGFLGKMLFSGQESLKMCNVLSGGEKVRCMISRMMLSAS